MANLLLGWHLLGMPAPGGGGGVGGGGGRGRGEKRFSWLKGVGWGGGRAVGGQASRAADWCHLRVFMDASLYHEKLAICIACCLGSAPSISGLGLLGHSHLCLAVVLGPLQPASL